MRLLHAVVVLYWSATKGLYAWKSTWKTTLTLMPSRHIHGVTHFVEFFFLQQTKEKEKETKKKINIIFSCCLFFSTRIGKKCRCEQQRAMNNRSSFDGISSFSSVSLHEISICAYSIYSLASSISYALRNAPACRIWRRKCPDMFRAHQMRAVKQFNCSHASHKSIRTSANHSIRRGFLIYRGKFSL